MQRDAVGWSKAVGHSGLALGWTAADLFGCDRRAPWHRLDRAGLVLLTGGHEIVELDADVGGAPDIHGIGAALPAPTAATAPVALLWELLISALATGPPIRGRARSI